jgi:hypothetical protein
MMERWALPVACLLSLVAVPVIGQAVPARPPGATIALSNVQPGMWEIKSRTDPSVNRSICISDPRVLIQLRHSGVQCSRYVISDDARSTTVHYSCAGSGHGQTTVRVETPRVVQLQSQGVDGKSPFSFSAEGRRIGGCGGGAGVAGR